MNFYSRRAQATTGADLCARWGKMTTWVTISHLDSDLIGHLDTYSMGLLGTDLISHLDADLNGLVGGWRHVYCPRQSKTMTWP